MTVCVGVTVLIHKHRQSDGGECAENHSHAMQHIVYYPLIYFGAAMHLTSFIKSLLLILLASAYGIKAFVLGCCCFNSVENLSVRLDTQWRQVMAFNPLSNLVSQLRCCHRLSLIRA